MTEALKGEIKDAIHGMAKKTLRTLCLAYKKIEDG
jgi:magnesium-transporting ATPase (P-type)